MKNQSPDVYQTLEAAEEHTHATALDVYAVLRARIEEACRRPCHLAEVELAHFHQGTEGAYTIVKNLHTDAYLRLTPPQLFLWNLLDGQHTLRDIFLAYYLHYGEANVEAILGFLDDLRTRGFLAEPGLAVWERLRAVLARRHWLNRLVTLAAGLISYTFPPFPKGDRVITGLYRAGGWLLYTRPVLALTSAIALFGTILFAIYFATGAYRVAQIEDSYGWGLPAVYVAFWLSIAVHELAHAFTCKAFGRKVNRIGLMIYYAAPVIYVDTSDLWMAPKRARMAASWAGPFSNLVIGGAATLALAASGDAVVRALLYQFAFLQYTVAFFNLCPLLELDGYFLLMDWLEMPLLRKRSFEFLTRGLWAKIKSYASLTRQEGFLAVFGLLSAGFSVFILWTALPWFQRLVAGLLKHVVDEAQARQWSWVVTLATLALLAGPWAVEQGRRWRGARKT